MSATYRMVPGGATLPRRLNVNGIKTASTPTGDAVTTARSPAGDGGPGGPGGPIEAGLGGGPCFTLSPSSSIGGASVSSAATRTLPSRASVPPPPPPKPSWPPTASRLRATAEQDRRQLPRHLHHHEDGGLTNISHQSAPATTWDPSMPMLPEETTTTDVADPRRHTELSGSTCSGRGKLAMILLVGIPLVAVVAAVLAWFYSCREVGTAK